VTDHTLSAVVLDRRRFLFLSAGAAAGVLLAGCGSSPSGPLAGLDGDLQVVKRFPSDALVPGRVRLAVSLADSSGILGADGRVRLPRRLTASVVDTVTGATVVSGLVAALHSEGLEQPYWLFEVEIDTMGTFLLDIDDAPDGQAGFQLMDPSLVSVPVVGSALPPVDTPTVRDSRGVDPLCTRSGGPCPFHDITLAEALATGRPVAYLVGTPAFCSTGTCAPALDFLVERANGGGDTVFVHADIYTDSTATKVSPAVEAYGLTYEPVLFVTDATGIVRHRLDIVYDLAELRAVLP
jgi:hypothetical protein